MTKMRPLLLGEAEQKLIATLTAKAATEVVPLATMQRLAKATVEGRVTRAMRNMNNDKTIHLPFGYQITLTHEEHKPGVVCRHLSVSVEAKGMGPNEYAVAAIMEAFGFKNGFGKCPMWLEPCDDERTAVNVLEPLDGDVGKLKKEAT